MTHEFHQPHCNSWFEKDDGSQSCSDEWSIKVAIKGNLTSQEHEIYDDEKVFEHLHSAGDFESVGRSGKRDSSHQGSDFHSES